jgi:Putative prokaryotic signal transducing protein
MDYLYKRRTIGKIKCGKRPIMTVPRDPIELVPVFASGEMALIAVAKSLLDAERIDYFVKGEGLQNLFGLGSATGYSFAMGPAEFWVRAEDQARARELLRDLKSSGVESARSKDGEV